MDETELVKFDYTAERLREIVSETSGIVTVDINNKEDLDKVKKARISLGKIRNSIKDFGKSKRDYFNDMSKKIITREKELVAIVEEEEDRLSAFEEEAKKQKEIADRLAVLPSRKEQLEKLADGVEVSDEYICSLSSDQFMGYINQRTAEKNEKARLELEAREEKIRKAEEEANHKKEFLLAEEKARQDALENSKREMELAKEKAEFEKQEALKKAEEEKQAIIDENNRKEAARIEAEEDKKKEEEEATRQEKIKQEALEKDKKYKAWLKKNEYGDGDGMLLVEKNGFVLLYQFVDKYEK